MGCGRDLISVRSMPKTRALGRRSDRRRVVVIPVREIEAWLLADHEAVSKAFKLDPALRKQANPETHT